MELDKKLDLLRLRIEDFEQKVFGDALLESSLQAYRLNLAEMIAKVDEQLRMVTLGRDAFHECYAKLSKLHPMLTGDGDVLDSALSALGNPSSVVKFEEVLSFEDEIQRDAELCELLSALEPSLSQSHLCELQALDAKMCSMSRELSELCQATLEIDRESCALTESTNRWIRDIDRTVLGINQKLTELEQQRDQLRYE